MSAATGPVGVGVIGAGVISTQYLESLRTFADVRVLFVADLDLDRARAKAEEFGIPGWGSVDDLLNDDAIEIVVNLTIPAVHVEIAARAVRAGKHVWTEKPFSVDRASGEELLQLAAAHGARVATAPDTFLGSGLQEAQRLIADGAIGRPLSALAVMQSPGPDMWHPSPEFLFARGAGPLFDFGPYYVTALVQNLGPVQSVSATATRAREVRVIRSGSKEGTEFPVEVPTTVSALLRFEGGGSAQALFSFDSALRRAGVVEIMGEHGTLVLTDPNQFDGTIVLHRPDAEPQEIPTTAIAGRGTGVLELARAIRAGVPERASGALAYHVVDVLLAIAEAAESGGVVEVASSVESAPTLPGGWDPRTATL